MLMILRRTLRLTLTQRIRLYTDTDADTETETDTETTLHQTLDSLPYVKPASENKTHTQHNQHMASSFLHYL